MGVIFQPSDDTVFRVYANGTIGYADITVAKIKQDILRINSNPVCCWLTRSHNSNVYRVCTTNLDANAQHDPQIAYFATYPYIQYSYGSMMSYNLIAIGDALKYSYYHATYYNIDLNRLEKDTKLYWATHSDTVDGVKYWAFNAGDTEEGAIIYWGSGTPYLNNEPPVPPIVYNWQSVPSISGKNGILSLVTLDSESINDGEPVSGAAVSVFDQNPVSGNNVKDIVDGNTPLIPSAVDVTAAFIISNPPVGELASRILAAKKGSIPESIEDADKTVSIPANASNVTMPGLDENSQYYFAIFVADVTGDTAVSDPKDIYTGELPPVVYDFRDAVSITRAINDINFSDDITITKQ